ncbi:anaphase promoting complex 10 [Actinidia rufa]|uniref:Anaphase promoting complex 10 n=1 Tax=Actinidia rufa TaxID=165716 RepID=A0A7J0E1U7_9ERIC|nr:anaphase promoting complex 10 [Actinidia rufa]
MATESSEGEEESKMVGGNQQLMVEDDLREMANKAAWSVSSCKPGNGVTALRTALKSKQSGQPWWYSGAGQGCPDCLGFNAVLFPSPSSKDHAKSTWNALRAHHPWFAWHKLVWFPKLIPRHSFILWMAIRAPDFLAHWQILSEGFLQCCEEVGMGSHGLFPLARRNNRAFAGIHRPPSHEIDQIKSDGAQPHLVNIQFQKKVKLQLVVLYVDFKLDESYTPSKISIRAGDGFHNLKEVKTVELIKPTGWVYISLSGNDPR